jgi:hypothetical protein
MKREIDTPWAAEDPMTTRDMLEKRDQWYEPQEGKA